MPRALWIDQTDQVLDSTAQWTNKVELADLDGDGRPKEAIMKRYHCRARHESRVLKLRPCRAELDARSSRTAQAN
ncbi:MAG TPA: hypothetical protein EYM78_06155 [Gemmatimonadetes bacterium]|nr:hypothetical protein [Gemmatimonadota bacterium]HIN50280.1 hypothetical protein [Gemmatimonadota bacterium]